MTALPKGQYVKHYRYGFGVVTESDAELTSIEFELRGTKRFVTRLMVVELSDLTPPEPFRAKWVKTAPVADFAPEERRWEDCQTGCAAARRKLFAAALSPIAQSSDSAGNCESRGKCFLDSTTA